MPHLHGTPPQIGDLYLCVYVGAVEQVCCSDLLRGHSGDGYLSSSILFKYECRTFVCSELGQGTTGCFGVMYGEW